MKSLLLIFSFFFAAVAAGNILFATKEHPRGCIYRNGVCKEDCPEGTHAYTTGCSYRRTEPSCDQPESVQLTWGMICDYSACYCDAPTLRDTTTGKCVPKDQCPMKAETV